MRPPGRACRTPWPRPSTVTSASVAASLAWSTSGRSYQHHLRIMARRFGDRTSEVRLGLGAGRLQPAVLDQLGEHDLHLEVRERPADAAPHAAPERDPRIRPGRVVEEPL